MTDLANHLSVFVKEHLPRDQHASQHTVDSYSYCFELLLGFASERHDVRPCKMEIEHLSTDVILDFLDSLEKERGNTIRTRNLRLAAIKSFFRYLEYRAPACLELARQVHAIPSKRFDRMLVDYLDGEEMQALLEAPDSTTSAGIRDRAMLHLTYTAALRVSELTNLKCKDLHHNLDSVHIMGKGRRERVLPLWNETQSLLQDWLAIRPPSTTDHLFLNARRGPMTRHGVAHRLKLHARTAQNKVPSIANKHISPHVLRHSIAMHTLAVTRDTRKVSLWLGHSSILATDAYVHADPTEKLKVLAASLPPQLRKGSFRKPSDRLLTMLKEARDT